MACFRLTKKFEFEMAHALPDYNGACRNLHGHSYKLSVTVKGEQNKKTNEMVIDFHQLKELVQKTVVEHFDHSLVLNKTSYAPLLIEELQRNFQRVILLEFSPTTENLLSLFVEKIKKTLPEEVTLFSVSLQETERSVAEWYAEDNL
ncbi:MAG: 6-carboxytetrahydropterin synthase QueD [Bacteroidales bacterium]|nr:6-carboxytetrahydropterin synthase QueD [Bacteroidales bacterium]